MEKPTAIFKKLSVLLSALLLCCNINAANVKIAGDHKDPATNMSLLHSEHVKNNVVAKLALTLQQNIKETQKSYPAVINFSNLKSGEDIIPFHEGVEFLAHKPNNEKRK